jgi:hypothetical protein
MYASTSYIGLVVLVYAANVANLTRGLMREVDDLRRGVPFLGMRIP